MIFDCAVLAVLWLMVLGTVVSLGGALLVLMGAV